jgi:hypothetical protein
MLETTNDRGVVHSPWVSLLRDAHGISRSQKVSRAHHAQHPSVSISLAEGAPNDHAPLSAKEEDVGHLSVQLATVVSSRRMWVAPSTIPLTNSVGQEPAAGGMDTSSRTSRCDM